MKDIRAILCCAAMLVALFPATRAGPLEPPAGPPGPTMKTLSEVEPRIAIHQSDLPLTIGTDGSYYLAENLVANQDGVDMISVTAYYVSIDLNGFSMDGAGDGVTAEDCIDLGQEVRTFGLTNGTVRGCAQHGVSTNFPFALNVNVDRVQAIQNGQSGLYFVAGTYGVITRSVARANGERGMVIGEGVISECTAVGNGTIGLQVNYGVLTNCMAHSNAGANAIILSGGAVGPVYAP